MQLFSLIICFAKFTDHIRDVTDIRPPDRGFSRQESGLGLQDILSEKTWKLKKKIAGIIFTSGEKGNICFFLFVFFIFPFTIYIYKNFIYWWQKSYL